MTSQGRSDDTLRGRRNEKFQGAAVVGSLVVSVVTLLTLFVGVLQWGLKLEAELNEERSLRQALERRVATLEAKVGNGILPRAEERIDGLRRDLDAHERNHE